MSKALNQTGAIPGSCRDVERWKNRGWKTERGTQPGITSPLKRRRFQFQMSRPYNFDLRKNATAKHIIVNIWVMSMSFDVFETTTSSSKYRRDSLFSPRNQQKHANLLKIFSFPSLKFTHRPIFIEVKMGVSPMGWLPFKYPAIFHWTMIMGERVHPWKWRWHCKNPPCCSQSC